MDQGGAAAWLYSAALPFYGEPSGTAWRDEESKELGTHSPFGQERWLGYGLSLVCVCRICGMTFRSTPGGVAEKLCSTDDEEGRWKGPRGW